MSIIGIDLGTTNSLVSFWKNDGPVIIPNVLGSNLTPSVVGIDDNGEILIGEVAKERLITHPNLTAASFKRYMGTEKVFDLGKYSFSPQELSAFVLKSLKADAEAYLGYEVQEAVISVPAYFNDSQRKATKQAAELAGLKVERLINEPTAAAIAYGINQKDTDTKFLVFDLGGGTFDVSILELFDGIMEVNSIAGDNYLGGEDFTDVLKWYFIEHEGFDIKSLSSNELSLIYKQAELCKRDLSDKGIGKMNLFKDNKLYELKIERNDFESLNNQLLLRLRTPVERALRDAGILAKELDAVILIGGATRMPVVKSLVGKMFKKLPFTNINPDEAVALGAAIQAALKERNKALNEIVLTDVCPYTLGTSVAQYVGNNHYEGGHFLPIIERNTPIPVSKVERLETIRDYQDRITVEIYQGENRHVKNNVKLGELNIEIPEARAGVEKIDIRYTYDINGILEVEVITINTGARKRVIIEKSPGTMTKKEIEERLKVLNDIKIHPRERTEYRLLLAKGERLYAESLGEKRNEIALLLHKFEYILNLQNDKDIKKTARELSKAFDILEERFDYE
ncbi:MAG: molecular chaperone HscC [Anaerocolumna sp.]|nr:molecular chaperone HscC [Anaerocolumna sp.]